ncbi:unnamed protein product [Hanseniaspora opuntiae]
MNSFNSYDISLQSSNKSQGMKPNQELMIQENISYKAFIINITIFIQGFQTDFFKYKTKCTKHLAKNSRLDHHSHDDLNIDNLMLLKNHQNIEVEYLTETYLRATTSLKDLIDNFYIPLGRMIIFLQNACELVSKISAKKIGQMIIDYCQSEVVNCIISQYITKVNNLIERFIETDKFYNSTVVLSNLKNEIKKMDEYNLVHDAVNVLEEYISRLTMSVNTDRDIAEFQLFMQTIDNNIGVDLNLLSKNAVDIDGWISYDTRLPDTPQGMTILALIWKYARMPYKKRMLQNTHNVFVNKDMTQVDKNSYVPGTCVLNRFVYLLNSWINEGSVINEDSDNISKFDFMITDVFGENQELDAERIWEIKYNILKDGLDDFIKFVQPLFNDKVILEKVLEIGKLKRLYSLKMKQIAVSDTANSINSYMRTLQWPVLTCAIFEDANLFNEFLDVQYNNSNKIILRLLEEEYQISKLIPKLLDFYVYKVDSQDENLLLFLNNSLLDLTKYPTFDILTILQNRFVAVYKNFGKEDEMNFFGTIMPVFDDKTLLDHVNNFNQLQKDAKNVVNNNGTARNYRNFKDLKEMLLPSVTNTESEYGNQLMNVGNERKNTKLVSANYMKLQLDVSFPLSIVLTKTLVMQLEMVQRKLMNYYYMKKIMLDIFLEINKERVLDKVVE